MKAKVTRLGNTAYEWHKDNDGYDYQFVVWSNALPTEVRSAQTKRRVLKHAKDGDVILLSNAQVFHRAPEAARTSGGRWFLRARVYRCHIHK